MRWHWARVTELVNEKMEPLGLSVQGCATDGDARRYKIQKEDMLKANVDAADWAWGGVHRLLDYCCRTNAAGQTEGLHMQDPKHAASSAPFLLPLVDISGASSLCSCSRRPCPCPLPCAHARDLTFLCLFALPAG